MNIVNETSFFIDVKNLSSAPLALLIRFPLDLRTNLLKNIEIEMPPGENFAVNFAWENSSNEGTFPIG